MHNCSELNAHAVPCLASLRSLHTSAFLSSRPSAQTAYWRIGLTPATAKGEEALRDPSTSQASWALCPACPADLPSLTYAAGSARARHNAKAFLSSGGVPRVRASAHPPRRTQRRFAVCSAPSNLVAHYCAFAARYARKMGACLCSLCAGEGLVWRT